MAGRTPQVICFNDCYTVAEFRKRMGIGDFAMRKLRADGLHVVEVGRKRFIRGSDWYDFLGEAANQNGGA